tara:strand:+ start:108 stop:329 length:222 start_codon:yes stop_codon:yes gene_type:complete
MLNYNKKINIFIISLYFYCIFFSRAYAYLDPGSISIVLQSILAAIAGVGATYRLWIFKVKNFFGKKKKKNFEK